MPVKNTKPAAVPAPAQEPAKTGAAKTEREIEAFRKEMQARPGAEVYQRAPEIMFAEAAADRIQFLCEDDPETFDELVLAGGTLRGCVEAIVRYCRRDIGNSGELSEADFRAAIRDYYRLPEAADTKDDPEQKAKNERPAPAPTRAPLGQKLVGPKPKAHAPTMLGTQLDMFAAMTPEDGEKEGEE